MKSAFSRAAALLLALFLVLGGIPAYATQSPLTVSLAEQARGLYISTGFGGDFPSAPELPKDTLKAELDDIVTFAKQYGYTEIYFEAATNAEAMYRSGKYGYSEALYEPGGWFSRLFKLDPLDYLVKQAKREGIAVAAVISPFSASATEALPDNRRNLAVKNSEYTKTANGALWFDPGEAFTQKLLQATVKELAKKYELSAILLRDFAYPTQDFNLKTSDAEKSTSLTELLQAARKTAQGARSGLRIGLEAAYPAEAYTGGAFTGFADLRGWLSASVDFVVPVISETAAQGYAEAAQAWAALRATTRGAIPFYTLQNAQRLSASAGAQRYEDPLELESQLFLNNQQALSGCIISGYTALRGELSATAGSLAAMFSPQPTLPLNDMTLDIAQEFHIARPAEPITVNTPTYFISGTSDGLSPVLLDGEEIGQGRTFGTLVELKKGRNEFTFTCGGQSETAVITYGSTGSGTPATIEEARQSTMFPTRQELSYPGDDLTLACVAPSGAELTARVDGQSITLEQVAPADDGIPARFTGTLTLTDGYPVDEVTDVGPVTYVMTYNDTTKEYTSTGTLLAVGDSARLAIEVTDQRGDTSAVNTAADFRDNMIGSVETGARDDVIDTTYSFFQLSCGGWVDREDVSVLTGVPDVDATAAGAPTFSADKSGETYKLNVGGARPYYLTQLTDDTLTVTLYNTSGVAEHWDTAGSKLFSAVTAEHDAAANSTRITFQLQHKLWGYNVEYHGDEIWIFAKNTPMLSATPGKPLTGMTIVVDAGHGGNDPGAIGVAGEYGPAEKQLNYLNACMTSIRLEQLGATVIQTQTADERLSYARRMDPARDSRADFYICLHHNSMAESVNGSGARGVEVYYIENLAQPLAAALTQEISAVTGRQNRGDKFATFRVTQMTHTPSVLVELGFVVNPEEYVSLCSPLTIYRTAIGVSNGIIRTVQEAGGTPQTAVQTIAKTET